MKGMQTCSAKKRFLESSKNYHAGWTRLNCLSGAHCGGLCIKSAGGPEWRDLFIQGPECRGVSFKSVTYSREHEIKSSGCCFAPGKPDAHLTVPISHFQLTLPAAGRMSADAASICRRPYSGLT